MDWSPLWISLGTAIPATVITLLLGIYAAWKNRKTNTKLSHVLDVLFTLPMVLPPTVMGFLLLLLLGKNGAFGKLLLNLGIQVVFTRSAAVIAAVIVAFPLMYRSAKAAFEQVDQNLIYAARIMKISESKIFLRIIMPIALPGVASGTILAFARALGEFGATLMIAGNIQGKTQTMPLAIYMAIQSGNEQEAVRWVLILLLLSFLMILSINGFAKGRKSEWKGKNHELIS